MNWSHALIAVLGLAALPAAADVVAAVRACVDGNTPRISTVQKIGLTVHEGGEESFSSEFTLYWRRLKNDERRILLRFREPEDLAGAALLVTAKRKGQPEVHIYLPDQGRPRSVSSRGELEGFLGRANLGIDELELLLDPIGRGGIRVAKDPQEVDGRAVWLVEQRSSDDERRFARIVTFVDQEFCVPLRAELYDADDVERKVLEVDAGSFTQVAGSWMPRHLVFRDLAENSETVLQIQDLEVDRPFSPALLTVEALQAGR